MTHVPIEISFVMTAPPGIGLRVWIAKHLLRLAGWLCSTRIRMEVGK